MKVKFEFFNENKETELKAMAVEGSLAIAEFVKKNKAEYVKYLEAVSLLQNANLLNKCREKDRTAYEPHERLFVDIFEKSVGKPLKEAEKELAERTSQAMELFRDAQIECRAFIIHWEIMRLYYLMKYYITCKNKELKSLGQKPLVWYTFEEFMEIFTDADLATLELLGQMDAEEMVKEEQKESVVPKTPEETKN